MAEDRGCSLEDLSLEDLRTLNPAFEADVMRVWDPSEAVERRNATGGTSRRAVQEQAMRLHALAHAGVHSA